MSTPTPADKFSFGLWTVGWQGRDPFGEATRPELDVVEAVHRLAELGAYGLTFHDDDLFGFEATNRDQQISRLQGALAETGLIIPMVTTNLFSHPVFKDGGFTSNDRGVRRFALRKVLRNVELAAELGAKTFVLWGGREGSEYDIAKDVRAALDRYREAMNLLTQFVTDRGYDLRFAIEPKPNEPRGDILLPTVGHALAFITTLDRPELVGAQPRGRARADGRAELRARHRAGVVARQALPHRPQRPAQHQVRPGPGVRARRPDERVRLVDLLETAGYDGPRHFDYKPSRTEDIEGVWESAAANMRTYLLLKERALAFRADPDVQEALAIAGVADLSQPTLDPGEASTGCSRRSSTRTRRASADTASCSSTSSRSSTSPEHADMTLVAGVDSSTQSCKVVVRDAETGKLLREGRASHPDGTWCIRALVACVRGGGGRRRRARRRGRGERRRSAARHGLPRRGRRGRAGGVAVERHPFRGSRGRSCGRARAPTSGRRGSDCVPVASFTITKLRWLAQHEPANAKRTAAVCLPHDWLTWRLRGTGDLADLVTDRSDASGTGYFDSVANAYTPDLLEWRSAPTSCCRECWGPAESVTAGICGSARAPVTTPRRCSGWPANVLVSLGTSGVVTATSDVRAADPSGVVAGFADATGRFLPLACTLNAARVLDTTARMLGVDLGTLSTLALSAPAGAEGVVLVPYLEGERTPNLPDATGALHGLTLTNATPANIARAAIEGMLCGLAVGLDALASTGRGRHRRATRGRGRGFTRGTGDRADGVRRAGDRARAGRVRG